MSWLKEATSASKPEEGLNWKLIYIVQSLDTEFSAKIYDYQQNLSVIVAISF